MSLKNYMESAGKGYGGGGRICPWVGPIIGQVELIEVHVKQSRGES